MNWGDTGWAAAIVPTTVQVVSTTSHLEPDRYTLKVTEEKWKPKRHFAAESNLYAFSSWKISGKTRKILQANIDFPYIFFFFQSEHSRQKLTWLQLICKHRHSLLFCYPFLKSQLTVMTVDLPEKLRRVFLTRGLHSFLPLTLASGVKTSITEAEF